MLGSQQRALFIALRASWWFINDGHTARRDERKKAMREKEGDGAGEIKRGKEGWLF